MFHLYGEVLLQSFIIPNGWPTGFLGLKKNYFQYNNDKIREYSIDRSELANIRCYWLSLTKNIFFGKKNSGTVGGTAGGLSCSGNRLFRRNRRSHRRRLWEACCRPLRLVCQRARRYTALPTRLPGCASVWYSAAKLTNTKNCAEEHIKNSISSFFGPERSLARDFCLQVFFISNFYENSRRYSQICACPRCPW